MPLTLRVTAVALALICAPFSVLAQSSDAELAAQIDAVCASDAAACGALVASLPPGSALQERALGLAISSNMTEAQVAQVVQRSAVTPVQATRLQRAAVQRGRTSGALATAFQTASARTGGITITLPFEGEQEGSPA